MLFTCFLMVHDARRSCKNDVSELTRWEVVGSMLVELSNTDVETGTDNGALVETSSKVDDDLASTMVIDDLEFSDVT